MKYVVLSTLEVINIVQLQAMFPLVGFPPDVGNEALEEYGVAVLEYDQVPELTGLDEYIPGPVRIKDGHAYQGWVIVPATTAQWVAYQTLEVERLQRLSNAQVTALQGRVDALNDAVELDMATPEEIAEQPVRAAQLKAWKTYRVLVGRVPTQATWPQAPVWPVQSEAYTNETSAVTPQTV
jgi:hypothetical protein